VFTKSGRNHRNFYINIINWKTELTIGTHSSDCESVAGTGNMWCLLPCYQCPLEIM